MLKQLPFSFGVLIPNLNLLWEKIWVSWIRAVWRYFGLFFWTLKNFGFYGLGLFWGFLWDPYAWAPSIMLFPSPSKALIPNLDLLYERIWVLWIRVVWGCFGLFLGPLGRYMGVSWFGQPLPRSPLSLRCFSTKYDPSISKTLGFMDQGCFGLFWGCFGLFFGPLGWHMRVC